MHAEEARIASFVAEVISQLEFCSAVMLTCRAFAYESRVKRSSLPIPTILSSVKMDDDQADVLKSVVCLLTVASVAKAKAKARAKKKPHTITKIVLAACTLHNLLTPTRAGEDPVAPDMRDVENPLPGIRVVPFGHNTGTALGKRVREYLTEYYSGVGAVPWQNAMVGLQD
uniref:DDE Tnp4 domain-containing protein n=1 Tax=Branchiostoma floridae TaxID=7739 RepID=C3YZ15_BRAFL|eukprot:XP_002598511.1 hypothetical protein BRAFLDRAFT_66888 [Branchiostoma floridae]